MLADMLGPEGAGAVFEQLRVGIRRGIDKL